MLSLNCRWSRRPRHVFTYVAREKLDLIAYSQNQIGTRHQDIEKNMTHRNHMMALLLRDILLPQGWTVALSRNCTRVVQVFFSKLFASNSWRITDSNKHQRPCLDCGFFQQRPSSSSGKMDDPTPPSLSPASTRSRETSPLPLVEQYTTLEKVHSRKPIILSQANASCTS